MVDVSGLRDAVQTLDSVRIALGADRASLCWDAGAHGAVEIHITDDERVIVTEAGRIAIEDA